MISHPCSAASASSRMRPCVSDMTPACLIEWRGTEEERDMGDDFGKLVLRLTLGILVLLHGIAKLRGGVGFLTPMVTGLGLPPWFAYGVYVGEIVAPIMVILGLFTRVGAFIIFVNM